MRTIRERDDGRRRADEGHASLTVQVLFFYADDGLVAYTDPGWLQSEFDTLTRIFDRVGMRKNVHKTMGMVCKPFRTAKVRADKAHTRKMTGGGTEFQGETVGTCALPGVREEIGEGVTGGTPPNSARCGARGVREGEQRGKWGQLSQDFQDGVSRKIGTEALPSRRV